MVATGSPLMDKDDSPGSTLGAWGIVVVVVEEVVVDVELVDEFPAIVVETRGIAAWPTGAVVVELFVGAGTVVVVAAVVDVLEATVVVVVVVEVLVVDEVAGATDVVGEDVDGEKVLVTHTAAPAPPEHVCHPALEVQCELPLANSGFSSNCDVPAVVVCSSFTQSRATP